MSYQAQNWVDQTAIPQGLVHGQGELLVLLRIANHTGGDLRGCFAKAATLASECLMGESTARKHLRALRRRGVIVYGDPDLVSHLRADQRPPVYDLAGGHEPGCRGRHSTAEPCTPSRTTGARIEHPAGVQIEHPEPVTGARIDASRVLESSTRTLKGLNPPSSSPPPTPPPEEDEELQHHPGPGEQETSVAAGSATVVTAYAAAYEAQFRARPPGRMVRRIESQAAGLLRDGWPPDHLARLAAELPARGYLDLERHAEHNPPPAVGPALVAVPDWCGNCADATYRYVPADNPARPCPVCSPQAAHARREDGGTRCA
ncbi:helix-turn-helix domain-containing protein [Streptomyces sp. cg36]|uniref:helix-turn-helix domain-containing protein n=1 Tax=Streptomyces sp. cg36 TaxID=3238798 RepID=UPI0034E1FB8F